MKAKPSSVTTRYINDVLEISIKLAESKKDASIDICFKVEGLRRSESTKQPDAEKAFNKVISSLKSRRKAMISDVDKVVTFVTAARDNWLKGEL